MYEQEIQIRKQKFIIQQLENNILQCKHHLKQNSKKYKKSFNYKFYSKFKDLHDIEDFRLDLFFRTFLERKVPKELSKMNCFNLQPLPLRSE